MSLLPLVTSSTSLIRHRTSIARSARWQFGVMRTLVVVGIGTLAATCADRIDDDDFNTLARQEHDPYRVNDIRLGYTMLPAGAKVSVIDRTDGTNPANYSKDTNWDLTGRTGVMWMTPWSGLHEDGDFILGFEVSTNHLVIEQNPNSPEIDIRTYQFTLHPGVGWVIDEHLHIELNPYVSGGISEYEQNFAGSGSDIYYEFGMRAAGYYTWENGFQLGLQLAYHYGKTRGEIDPNYDVKFEIQGITVGLQLGFRL
jgi:hypothetical protein